MRFWWRGASAVWLAVVFGFGCDDGGGGSGGGDPCESVTCGADETCVDGACVPPVRDAGGGGSASDDVGAPEPDAAPPEPDACVPTDEVCNGVDDDCDGATDEAWPESADPCELGVGACAAAGTIVCDEVSSVAAPRRGRRPRRSATGPTTTATVWSTRGSRAPGRRAAGAWARVRPRA
jgi:hypothetical protein